MVALLLSFEERKDSKTDTIPLRYFPRDLLRFLVIVKSKSNDVCSVSRSSALFVRLFLSIGVFTVAFQNPEKSQDGDVGG